VCVCVSGTCSTLGLCLDALCCFHPLVYDPPPHTHTHTRPSVHNRQTCFFSRFLAGKNRCLRRLDLSHSVQDCKEIAAFVPGLEANVGLEELLLEGSNFVSKGYVRGGAGIKPLINALKGHRTVAVLSLARSIGAGADLGELPTAIQSGAPMLKAVNVTDCGVSPRDMRALIDAIKHNTAFELRAEDPYPAVLQKARELHSTIAKLSGGGSGGFSSMFDVTFSGCINDGVDALLVRN
jgi:hypothetical protein